jgi:arsenate reductase-like glutaredoxin family protein
MVERARNMERDDHTDQNLADEMPDENAVGQRPMLADNGGKVDET